jgi:hypothetical protein
MGSYLIVEIDRIYRINWIYNIPGFRMKPGTCNPLRRKIDRQYQGTGSIHYQPINHGIPDFVHVVAIFSPAGGCYFHGIIPARLA